MVYRRDKSPDPQSAEQSTAEVWKGKVSLCKKQRGVCVCVDKGINKISRLECVALHHQQALIRFTVIEKFLISSPSSIIVAERSPSRARYVINSAQLMATRMTLLWVLQELICYKNTENVCMCGYVAHD